MGTGTILWCTCVVAFQQTSVRSCWQRRFSIPRTASTFVHYLNRSLSWSHPPAWSSIPASPSPHLPPPARSLDVALASFSPAELPRDSPAHADSRCCSICAIPATLLCPCCEIQFCRSHVYQCADCQARLCGRCLDLHRLEGHWSDSDTTSAMLASAGRQAPRNQLSHAERQQLPRARVEPNNPPTHAQRQQLARVRVEHNQVGSTNSNQLAPARAHHHQLGPPDSYQLAPTELDQLGWANRQQLAEAQTQLNQASYLRSAHEPGPFAVS